MAKTFACPYCEKQYPHSASLIGRKLRCSGCKNVIQLMSDGTVEKVGTAESLTATAKKTGTAPQKQLTSRQKKQVKKAVTRSIQRSKSLLNTAAQSAIDQIDAAANQAAQKNEQQAPTAKKPEAQIVRSNYGRKYQLNSLVVVSISALLCIVILLGAFWEPSREVAALQHFASPVSEEFVAHPHRLPAYRDRMWLHTRDGLEAPPIILDADDASITFVERVEWTAISQSCNNLLQGMSLLRRFGMWVSSDKQVMVGQLWEEFDNKSNLAQFYALLKQKNIKFVFCEAVPMQLEKEGVSKKGIYLASLLLAGTGDKRGGACRDLGLASDEFAQSLEIYEFNGDKSLTLVEKNNEYEVSGGGHYSGLIAGFIETSQAAYEFKVIDIRFAKSMKAFYEDRYNPLRKLTESARIRMLSEFVEPDANTQSGIEVNNE